MAENAGERECTDRSNNKPALDPFRAGFLAQLEGLERLLEFRLYPCVEYNSTVVLASCQLHEAVPRCLYAQAP